MLLLLMRVLLALSGLLASAMALDNGLGRTPPMGFNVRRSLQLYLDECT